jgi:hypothetical protein
VAVAQDLLQWGQVEAGVGLDVLNGSEERIGVTDAGELDDLLGKPQHRSRGLGLFPSRA